jgi:hypothetical protein
MDAPTKDLLHELAHMGVAIRIESGRVRCAPSERLTDDLRARIRDAKADLLRLFTHQAGANSREVLSNGTDKTARRSDADPSVSSGSAPVEESAESRGADRAASARTDAAASQADAIEPAALPVDRPGRLGRRRRAKITKAPSVGTDKTDKSAAPDPSGSSVSSPETGSRCHAPTWPCRGCGSLTFWSLPAGTAWVCQRCHPTDGHPEEIRWHVVEDARRILEVVRRTIGCDACKGSGFKQLGAGAWTVCHCNDGFERRDPAGVEGGAQ